MTLSLKYSCVSFFKVLQEEVISFCIFGKVNIHFSLIILNYDNPWHSNQLVKLHSPKFSNICRDMRTSKSENIKI